MTRREFDAIIADIEKHTEGDGYFIRVRPYSNTVMEGGWAWLDPLDPDFVKADVIVLSDNDAPPFYIPLSSIESIQLSAR